MEKTRYITKHIQDDLKKKMIFIGGPRQVGKTTLAQSIGHSAYSGKTMYLNWDYPDHQKIIIKRQFNPSDTLLIFDELHKYRPWRNYIKGLYDVRKKAVNILITGSARLDFYRRGGDSLQGRYHYYRLHPFSLGELLGAMPSIEPFTELVPLERASGARQWFELLAQFGGFPEPLFAQDMNTLRRWQNERMDRMIREDIRDIELVRDISSMQTLSHILPEKVGGLFSLNALREDLQVTHKAVALWVDIFERFYYHFRIPPFTGKVMRSLKKQPKLYLWDWSTVSDDGARFENMIASHLLKFVHYMWDTTGHRAELFFLRDTDGHEVDFLVAVNRKPWFMVETKHSSRTLSRHMRYFKDTLCIPFAYQIVRNRDVHYLQDDIHVMSADVFLSGLV
ncbi:ATP-binding protein [Candidatus Uhrbacteria bacterium]|nr:ATP-binding protein [Candidatus Uhrbacteria bacterium]